MIRFVIISSKEEDIRGYKNIINKEMIKYDLVYEYYVFNSNDKSLKDYCDINNSTSVFIVEDNASIDSLEVVYTIREECKMYASFIIIIDKNNKVDYIKLKSKYSFLIDIINEKDKIEEGLVFDLKYIISVVFNRKKVLTFCQEGQIYKIPFADILFIEKETNSKKCIIHCKESIYKTSRSLTEISSMLDDNFIKTHQSAIVNKSNIKNIVYCENKIIFSNNSSCDLISRSNKKLLKDLFTK